MEVKVGDKVRCLIDQSDISQGGVYEVVVVDPLDMSVRVIDDVGDNYWLFSGQFKPITADTSLTDQIKARMENHMSNGEYTLAVKWAEVLEMVEGLEGEA